LCCADSRADSAIASFWAFAASIDYRSVISFAIHRASTGSPRALTKTDFKRSSKSVCVFRC
jgi:hypothetical protein